ncbi:MAG: HEAT repeat domain-containing protein [Planctomycetota bacterium]
MSIRSTALCVAVLLAAACSSTSKRADKKGGEFAELPSPVSRARLEARVENIKYQKGVTLVTNLERIAANGEAAIPVCLKGIQSEDAMTRMGCAYVLGRVGDPRTIAEMTKLLEDPVDYVRYEAAAALGAMGSRDGYGILVRGLEDERIEYRYKCFEALKDFTGQTFGYSHNAAPEARQVAVEQWNAWLQKVEAEQL